MEATLTLIREQGIKVEKRSHEITPGEVQKILTSIEETPEEPLISRLLLRSMARAIYTPECSGHFGLAASYYCHFTSPIRRYPDLQIHRIIKDDLRGRLDKGGRIGKAAALAGAILNIKPIIVMRDGELYPESKVRGHKKALKTIMEMTRSEIGSEKEHYRVLLVRGEKERHATVEEMRQTLLAEGFDVMDEIWPVGITIGTHTGPTPIGICYIKKYEYVK